MTKPTVAVIGAGAGGIAMGIQLAAGGFEFTIFDSAASFGNTWRKNTYPGPPVLELAWVTGQTVFADGGLALQSPIDAYGQVQRLMARKGK